MDLFAFDDLYVRRLREHDRVTEEHFYRYFRPILFATLRDRIAVGDIDDVVQEVFVRVLPRLDQVRDGHKFGAFVLGVCNNIVLERYRNHSPTEPLTDEHAGIRGQSDIEAEFFKDEAAAHVRFVLGQMPPKDADILQAVFLKEEHRDDICRRCDVTPEYLRVLLHRAKEQFRAAFRRKK